MSSGCEADALEEALLRNIDQLLRLGAKLHPLTIEQNAITSFKSRTTLVPCRANTIGPGLFLQADYAIGGADGTLGRGMQWQGMSLWMTLRHEKTPWITSSYIPTLDELKEIRKESDVAVYENNEVYVFYTHNHYNDFREYLNYYGGWGQIFGNVTGGGEYSSKTNCTTVKPR